MNLPSKATLLRVGSVGVASVIAGLAGLVIMILTAKVLTPAQNAEFMVFWSVLFWVFGVLGGIQYETVRSVQTTQLDAAVTPSVRGVAVVPAGLIVSVIIAVVFFVSALMWGPRVFGHQPIASALIIAVAAALYGGYSAILGALGGRGDWVRVAGLMTGDTVIRSGAMILVAVVAAALTPIKLAAGLGALAWVVFFVVSRSYRSAWSARGDATASAYARQVSASVVANLANSALVVGFPTVLGLVVGYDTLSTSAGLLFAISMTRAPLMMPLVAFQSMIVAHFVQHEGSGRVIARLVVVVAGLSVVVAVAAGLIGPPLLGLLRPEYHLSALVIGALTLGAGFLTLVVVTGTLALAVKLHTVYMGGWIVAIVVTVIVLALPGPITNTVIAALMIGPSCGAIIHVVGLMRSRRKIAAANDPVD
ncbi:MAG: hypothetical protein LBV06_00655 [Propionibacteriaceae bacterium]|jgi:O-antigen/teichoic acid export membrane protein|nr:hypothetical protein [Propionibacteriaceae bacterium]